MQGLTKTVSVWHMIPPPKKVDFPLMRVGFATGSGSTFSKVLWIRILQNDTDPGGSGPGSGSETLKISLHFKTVLIC